MTPVESVAHNKGVCEVSRKFLGTFFCVVKEVDDFERIVAGGLR